jgi:hypothetical protein
MINFMEVWKESRNDISETLQGDAKPVKLKKRSNVMTGTPQGRQMEDGDENSRSTV